jgi:hypothetical protein
MTALFEEIGQPKVELGLAQKSWHARLRFCALSSTGARNGGQHPSRLPLCFMEKQAYRSRNVCARRTNPWTSKSSNPALSNPVTNLNCGARTRACRVETLLDADFLLRNSLAGHAIDSWDEPESASGRRSDGPRPASLVGRPPIHRFFSYTQR